MRLFLLIVLMNLIYTQSWTIDSAYSYISYEGVHPFHSFIGKTNNIDFELNCENGICKLRIVTLIDGFDSGNNNRDSNMLYYTQALLYPTISYESEEFGFDGNFNRKLDLVGTLNFHGITYNLPIEINLKKDGNDYWGACNFKISLNVFNIDRPTLLMIPIADTIKIDTKLKIIEK